MQLAIESYLSCRSLSPEHAATLRRRVNALAKFVGKNKACDCFTSKNVNAFLDSLDRAPATIKGYRGDLLSVWRWAADHGKATWPNPRHVKRPKVPAPLVECYSVDEALRLLKAAGKLTGQYDGIRRAQWWTTMIRVAWDTGLRRGDLWQIKSDQLRSDGVLVTVQSKTGQRIFHVLHESTVAAIKQMRRRGLLLPWPHAGCTFGLHFRQIVESSGVGRGTFKWFRRSSGSYVEAAETGAGPRHLGHSSPACFYRHYDAGSVTVAGRIQPPELLAG